MTDQPYHPSVPQPTQTPPYGAPSAYGAPAAYDAPAGYAGPPAYPFGSPWGPLAGWGTRVLAMLIDSLVQLIGLVPYIVGLILFVVGAPDSGGYDGTVSDYRPATEGNTGLMVAGGALALVGFVLMFGIQIWNRAFRQGRTGQSVGKKAMGIKLVDERTGQPIGAGMSFVRDLAHTLDGFFYLGYLWPLWDDKRQTFADKILTTVVVETPKS
jgi:uncharacterized RDD family membrane protein YckC